jgi:hypothetical protein
MLPRSNSAAARDEHHNESFVTAMAPIASNLVTDRIYVLFSSSGGTAEESRSVAVVTQ